MNNIIATFGIAHSGTNLLKKIFIDLFNNDNYNYNYRYLGHNINKNGKVFLEINNLNIPNLFVGIFNYRNEFDRQFSYIQRSITGGLKGFEVTDVNLKIEKYKDQIANKVIKLLNDTEYMINVKNAYNDILYAKRSFIKKCKQINVNYICLEYEKFYENFDYIFDNLKDFGINIDQDDKNRVSLLYSVENIFKISRSGGNSDVIRKKYNLLSNHVSYSKGEPYFWTKFLDFEQVFKSLPQKNKECFRYVTKNHPYKSLIKV